jgi:hypothetical protein
MHPIQRLPIHKKPANKCTPERRKAAEAVIRNKNLFILCIVLSLLLREMALPVQEPVYGCEWRTWMVYSRVILRISIPKNTPPTTFFHKRSLKKPKRERGWIFGKVFVGFFFFFSFFH